MSPPVTMCVVVAACLVGVGTDAKQSRSARSLELGRSEVPSKRHLRSDKLTNDEEARTSNFDFQSLDEFIMYFENQVRNDHQVSNEVVSAPANTIVVNDMSSNIHPTSVGPHSTRPNDKDPAEVVNAQFHAEVLSDQNRQNANWLLRKTHPTEVLKALKLDEAGDDLLERTQMLRWIQYVDRYNKKKSSIPTTVVGALKDMGFTEENLVNMVFSWDMRRKGIKQQVKDDLKALPEISRKQMEEALLLQQENARMRVIKELMDSWLNDNYFPVDVCARLGLLPTLPTGYDFARFIVWVKYVSRWNKNKPENQVQYISTLHSLYTLEQMKQLTKQADAKDRDLADGLMRDIDFKRKIYRNAASTSRLSQEHESI